MATATPGSRLAGGTDWLRVPVLGPFLRWRHSRKLMQLPVFLVAVVGATWLKYHWSGANVWLMATPVVAALLWLVFTYLTRLLPATV